MSIYEGPNQDNWFTSIVLGIRGQQVVLTSVNGALSVGALNGGQVFTTTLTTNVGGTSRTLTANMTLSGGLASGTVIAVRGVTTLTGSMASGAFLYGVQGKAVVDGATVAAGSGYVTGILGQLSASGATLTSGHIAGVISSIQGVPNPASKVNMFYGESATGSVINSMFQAFGKSTYVFDLESNVYNQMSTTGTVGTTAAKGWLKCFVEGVVRYIPLADSVS